MGLAPGDRLGPYEIREIIGKGGMGEVYRAHDARLKRDVAIKTSAEPFSHRFTREARAIASLNHPHVCTLYDTGAAPGVPGYLVLELVDGREPRGPMSLDEALPIAGQVASALAAAHEKGLVHRDLKPANLKVRADGSVKVLDFGLATQVRDPASDEGETAGLTLAGMVTGTPAYMAPEQTRGGAADRRADIWAFGVVLYELLTGRRPFDGGSVDGIFAAIQTRAPDLAAVPPRVQRLLGACLAKHPDERLADIRDWRLLLDEVGDGDGPARRPRRMRDTFGWAAAAAGIAAGGYGLMAPRAATSTDPPVTFNIPVPGGIAETATFAVSPDGRAIAISAQQAGQFRLHLRALNALEARELPGTDGAREPFWSPDGTRIGFFADGAVKTIAAGGGPLTTLASTAFQILGASWGPHGILYAAGGRVLRIDAGGGTAEVLYEGRILRNPTFLADGIRFTYTADSRVLVGSLDRSPPVDLDVRSLRAQPTSDGYVFTAQNGRLVAQRLQTDPFALAGPPTIVTSQLTQAGIGRDFSIGGTTAAFTSPQLKRLAWVDRAGVVTSHLGPVRPWTYFRLSPDGSKVAFNEMFDGRGQVVLLDVRRGTTERVTFEGYNLYPTFSHDGQQLAFASMRFGRRPSPYVTRVGAPPNQETLFGEVGLNAGEPLDWSPDGQHVLFWADGNLWIVPRPGTGKPYKFVDSGFEESGASFSPDGRWIAYASTESGRQEVYVRPFPDPKRVRYTVSSGGGAATSWRRDGRELYYVGGDGWLHAVPVTSSEGSLQFGAPERLFAVGAFDGMRRYEPSADGRRFLIATLGPDAGHITVLLNWPQALAR